MFDYGPGESTATFDNRSFPDPNPPPIAPAQTEAATDLCTRVGLSGPGLADCVFDVAATGDAGFAVTDANSTLVRPQTLGAIAAGAIPAAAIPAGVPTRTDHGYPITVDGPAVTASIAADGGDVATFTFEGTAGQKVYVAVTKSTLPDDCGTLTMHGPDNALIAGGCIINGTGSIEGTVLPVAGQYSIVFDPGSTVAGDIELRISSATDVRGTISIDGPVVTTSIGQPGGSAILTFDGTAGQTVFLDVPSTALPDDCGALKLRGPDGTFVAYGCIINGAGSIDGTVLPSSGQYSVVVDPGSGATGAIQLRLHS